MGLPFQESQEPALCWASSSTYSLLAAASTMVLADLGRKLNAALSSLNRAPVVDEKVNALCVCGLCSLLTGLCCRSLMPS